MSLREDVARRLWDAAHFGGTIHKPWDEIPGNHPDTHDGWLKMADEAIRFAEAAWLQGRLAGTDETMSCGYSFERALGLGGWAEPKMPRPGHYPLTLPPEGWTP